MYVGELQVVERPSVTVTSDAEPARTARGDRKGQSSTSRHIEVDAYRPLGRQDGASHLGIVDENSHRHGDTVVVL